MKATKMLQSNSSVEKRAVEFGKSIKRNIQRDILDKLAEKLEKADDKIFELKDFSLDTNINTGQVAVTRDECEKRFLLIIECEYQRELIKRELEIKQASFDAYFSDEEEDLVNSVAIEGNQESAS